MIFMGLHSPRLFVPHHANDCPRPSESIGDRRSPIPRGDTAGNATGIRGGELAGDVFGERLRISHHKKQRTRRAAKPASPLSNL
jgi:hypothetical protein